MADETTVRLLTSLRRYYAEAGNTEAAGAMDVVLRLVSTPSPNGVGRIPKAESATEPTVTVAGKVKGRPRKAKAKTWDCPVCDKRYAHAASLRSHWRYHPDHDNRVT